ncbi:nuclear transport factor 2 family protein [Nocardia sp. 2]|uniref:Nuclear transport factor 2 family protein n=1 Tax=Nocardia acididurans TaxID=2802282 RepID=A0ABS1MIX4_9NOCA|nr:nuclear transport factor 2 family protein [Nocardia acididurans]MBL1079629.1 nuclear transport factor 2 family protein [Nocardia acididurans]
MFTDRQFHEALGKSRLAQPIPRILTNRAEPVEVLDEQALTAITTTWFAEYDEKIAFYAEHGFDIAWTLDWAKKYWWSWQSRDMTRNHELYTADLRYKDVTTLGATMIGLDAFVAYNFAFFDAIPDWRYDPIPGQSYLDIAPDGEVRMVVRYYGSGHLTGPLKLHPYDDTAAAIPGNGAFVQCTAVDRYHFNADHLMYEGETLYDLLDAVQTAGLLPAPASGSFTWLMRGAGLATRIATALNLTGRQR